MPERDEAGPAWAEVESYITGLFVGNDAVLDEVLRSAKEAQLPPIEVAPNMGAFLNLLARTINARSILEIGTLAGYSGIWLARALPSDGRLITLERNERHAGVARANFERAGLADRVEIRLGPALDSLAALAEERHDPFDLVFIDADKASLPAYLEWSLKLTRPGSLIVTDNVVRGGRVLDAETTDPDIQGVRAFNELLSGHPRLVTTEIQTVGTKGYDGIAVTLVTG